jgi:hypothetical protein
MKNQKWLMYTLSLSCAGGGGAPCIGCACAAHASGAHYRQQTPDDLQPTVILQNQWSHPQILHLSIIIIIIIIIIHACIAAYCGP